MPPKKSNNPRTGCGAKSNAPIVAPCGKPLFCFANADDIEKAKKLGTYQDRLKYWVAEELTELTRTVEDEGTLKQANELMAQMASANTNSDAENVAAQAHNFLLAKHKTMFALDANRDVHMKDSPQADIADRKYGYHLTKVDNIDGIAHSGLSPRAGASDRGSVAMSTSDQVKGSVQTSTGVVAFGLCPEVFRTYVNQYSDRQQMISGAPYGMSPAMLRFKIRPEVKKTSNADFMDVRATNTTASIHPDDIEILTENGWKNIQDYCQHDDAIPNLREEKSNPQGDWENKGAGEKTAIFDFEQMKAAKIPLFDDIPQTDPMGDVRRLIAQNGIFKKTVGGITYTFRGATLQTSGHRGNWEYAFSYTSAKDEPAWLSERARDYDKRYKIPAQPKDKSEFGSPSKPERVPTKVKAKSLSQNFESGAASGEGNNCLLSSMYQLFHGTKVEDQAAIDNMRQVLIGAGHADDGEMIDIYGGAGQQLANDMGVRIRVIQQTAEGPIAHPMLGQQGKILTVFHEGNHFTPLWPKG